MVAVLCSTFSNTEILEFNLVTFSNCDQSSGMQPHRSLNQLSETVVVMKCLGEL